MIKVYVKTSRIEYPVYTGSGLISSLSKLLSKTQLSKRVFVLIDKKIEKYYFGKISNVLNRWKKKIYYYPITANENSKSFKNVEKVYNRISKENFGRDTLLITIGGGTIGDLGGFVASTYMRGVQLIHIPTTLLAAVDSSIGGKTGINFSESKNIIGTFYQPDFVLTDLDFLKTLPENELISGAGEIIKYSYLSSRDFYSYLLTNSDSLLELDPEFLLKVISESVKLKASVVERDEFESTGLRKMLNFGHTFAHAFESYSDFKTDHGKVVIAGIVAALFLSFQKKIIDKSQLDYLLRLPLMFKHKKLVSDFNSEEVIEKMKLDKKSREGKLNFVLLKDFGEILIDVKAVKSEILYALNKTREMLL